MYSNRQSVISFKGNEVVARGLLSYRQPVTEPPGGDRTRDLA
jgi:hypothetical protein